ncbi:MAG: AAA family ATPase [Methyloligellaceae bacterium]
MIEPPDEIEFIPTKGHSRFEELARACTAYRYIGVCHGRPGVGKTRSAQEFAKWPATDEYPLLDPLGRKQQAQFRACQAVFYTATVANTPKMLHEGLWRSIYRLGHAKLRLAKRGDEDFCMTNAESSCPLVIVDEADRLTLKSFEELRDMYDRCRFGLILLGMPGLEKRLARYPQFYSRIGFVHEFKPLSDVEMRFTFEKHWSALGIKFDSDKFTDVEAMTAAMRITRGNFRLIERLFAQIRRIMAVNNVQELSVEVVESARECLVIGIHD